MRHAAEVPLIQSAEEVDAPAKLSSTSVSGAAEAGAAEPRESASATTSDAESPAAIRDAGGTTVLPPSGRSLPRDRSSPRDTADAIGRKAQSGATGAVRSRLGSLDR